jgi:hypothetical protein
VTCSAQQQQQKPTPTTPRKNGITIPKLARKQQQQESLADRMVQLQIENHDFGRRMIKTMQEQQQQQQLQSHRAPPLFHDWYFLAQSILGIISILSLASFLNMGGWMGSYNNNGADLLPLEIITGLWFDLRRAISTACLALAFQWILQSSFVGWKNRSTGSSSSLSLSQLLSKLFSNQWTVLLLTTLLGNPNPHSYSYYVRHVIWVIVPNMFHAVRSMIVAEAWNQFFRRFYKSLSRVLSSPASATTTNWAVGTPTNRMEPLGGTVVTRSNYGLSVAPSSPIPYFFQEGQSFVWTAIQRGTKKVFQTTVQKHVNRALGMIWTATMDLLRQVFIDPITISNSANYTKNALLEMEGMDDEYEHYLTYAKHKKRKNRCEDVEGAADEMDDITVEVATE